MKQTKVWMLLLAAMVLTVTAAPALAAPIPLSSPDALPALTEDGFLPDGADPVYFKDHAEGIWVYVDQSLHLDIRRYQSGDPAETYYIADIRTTPDNNPFVYSHNQEKPGRTNALPQDIAQNARAVYAQNGDFYSYRVANDKRTGVIIRSGEVLYSKTNDKLITSVPNLATLAFYPTGEAEVNESFEMSAADFQDRQAADVLAFGPVLIRGGQIPDLSDKSYSHLEPRSAFGIIEPGHYVGLLVEGRSEHAAGATLQHCAEILASFGVVDALNLDGGNTAAMLFMGESVMLSESGGVDVNDRAIPDILMVGTY